jgi:hypothetical protein
MKTTYTPEKLTPASLAELTSFQEHPCLSLYQTTHRRHPDNQQDPIRFRHLTKTLETSLRQQHSADAVQTLIAPFQALAQDHEFWNHTQDGLVVLGAPGLFRVFLLQSPVVELALVSDSFHAQPLRQILQSTERYQVLALSLHKVQLFEGNRNALDVITLAPGVPQTMTAALGEELSEPHSTVSSYGGVGGSHMAMHHGHGSKKDEIDSDAERFFRAVDRAVLEHHSRPSGLPLILAALPEHHHVFHAVSHNPFLVANGLMADPMGLTPDDLRKRAWEVAAPQLQAQQAASKDADGATTAKGPGGENLAPVTHAAVARRVAKSVHH